MQLRIDTYMSPILLNIADSVKADKAMKLFANSELARFCEPYVPSQTNHLAQHARITSECVTYNGPYAHYQYMGEVYGPNIPIRENGYIIGWRSKRGQKKHPTGRPLHYSQQLHPLAQDHWDWAAMATHKQDLADELAVFIADRISRGLSR